MATIHFDKLSMYDRIGEPVSLGIPFAQGRLIDSGQFGICNDGIDIAVQTDVTARWDDGSIKWLMAHFLADLPGNTAHDLIFATDGSISTPVLDQRTTVTQRGDLYTIDTGVLSVDVGCGTDLFKAIRVNDIEWFGANTSFGITDAEGVSYLAHIDEITILESGPVRSLVECAGKHVGDAGALFDVRVLIEAWAGKPFIRLDYQFINREKVVSVDVAQIALKFAASGVGDVRCATGEGYYRTDITEGANARLLDAETIVFQSVEHVS